MYIFLFLSLVFTEHDKIMQDLDHQKFAIRRAAMARASWYHYPAINFANPIERHHIDVMQHIDQHLDYLVDLKNTILIHLQRHKPTNLTLQQYQRLAAFLEPQGRYHIWIDKDYSKIPGLWACYIQDRFEVFSKMPSD